MSKQSGDTIPPYAAGDLIAAEARARLLAGVDEAVAAYDPAGPQTLDAAVATAFNRFDQDATRRNTALAKGLGISFPIHVPQDTFDRFIAESRQKIMQGMAAKMHAYSEGLWDEIERIEAEMTGKPLEQRADCFRQLSNLYAKLACMLSMDEETP